MRFELKNSAPQYNKRKDWCTKSPDKILKCNFNYACYLHDLQYGNHILNRQSRFVSDLALWKNIIKECWKVRRASVFWSWRVGMIYFLSVRLFGKKSWK